MVRCAAVASASSTISASEPPSSLMMRPYPDGSGARVVSTVTAFPAAACSRSSAASVCVRSSGMSAYVTTTVPGRSPSASVTIRTAWPVPPSRSCTTTRTSGAHRVASALTWSRP